MYVLARDYWEKLAPTKVAAFYAHGMLLSGSCPVFPVPGLVMFLRQFNSGIIDTVTLQVLYITGRELHGYEKIWEEGRHPHRHFLQCINVYKIIVYRARSAALQTVAALLRSKASNKDVARLIGKIVYQTRESDPVIWWRQRRRPEETIVAKKLKIK
jgi:hypothetical protein